MPAAPLFTSNAPLGTGNPEMSMESADGLDGLLGKREPHATFRDARLVAVSLDYRNNEAVTTWELCVGDPDDSMRAARERRRTGRLILSGVAFWVIDPPEALDARPGLPWLTGSGPLSELPTESRQEAGSPPAHGSVGMVLLLRELERAHVLRRPEADVRVGVVAGGRPRIDRAAARP